MKFEEKLVFLRKQKGLSREKAAEALNVSRQSLYKWESGAVIPGTEYLTRITKMYGVTLDDLVNENVDLRQKAKPEFEPGESAAEPRLGLSKKRRLFSMTARRVVMGICALALAIAVGVFFLKLNRDGRDVTPIEELESREVDISNWDTFSPEPLVP